MAPLLTHLQWGWWAFTSYVFQLANLFEAVKHVSKVVDQPVPVQLSNLACETYGGHLGYPHNLGVCGLRSLPQNWSRSGEKGLRLLGSSSSVHLQNDNNFWGFGFHSKSVRLVSSPRHEHGAWGVYEARWWGTTSLREITHDGWLHGDNRCLILQATDASFERRRLYARRDFPLRRLLWRII